MFFCAHIKVFILLRVFILLPSNSMDNFTFLRTKSVRPKAQKGKVTLEAHTSCSCCSVLDIREIPSIKKAKIFRCIQF